MPSQSTFVFHFTCYLSLHFSVPWQSVNKTVTFSDSSDIKGAVSTTTIPYDYLIYAVGAETQTFGIPGVKEHSCFMKELHDAEKVRNFQQFLPRTSQ
jgi:NADH dehydrogenase FAD-containing subunit